MILGVLSTIFCACFAGYYSLGKVFVRALLVIIP